MSNDTRQAIHRPDMVAGRCTACGGGEFSQLHSHDAPTSLYEFAMSGGRLHDKPRDFLAEAVNAPRETLDNFTLGPGWKRGRIPGDECMHEDDGGHFDCTRPLEFSRGETEGACEEHAEALGAIVRRTDVSAPPAAAPVDAPAIKRDWPPISHDDSERLIVQLAGVSVAAFGGIQETAKPGDYGWSVAYQDVVDLRRRYEKLANAQNEAAAPVERDEADDPACARETCKLRRSLHGGDGWTFWIDEVCVCPGWLRASTPAPSPAPGGVRRTAREVASEFAHSLARDADGWHFETDEDAERFDAQATKAATAMLEADRAAQQRQGLDRLFAEADALRADLRDRAAQPSDTAGATIDHQLRAASFIVAMAKRLGVNLDELESEIQTLAAEFAAAPPGLVPVVEVARWLELDYLGGGEQTAAQKLRDGSWLRDLERLDGAGREAT
jgi:nitrogen fixation protein FixH